MRNIKFRVWDRKAECMRPVYQIHFTDDQPCNVQTSMQEWLSCAECVLMQFTGLLDRNGKEIYEGDIVKDLQTGNIYPVAFSDFGFWLEYPNGSNFWPNEKYREVIGSIHENPSLLPKS